MKEWHLDRPFDSLYWVRNPNIEQRALFDSFDARIIVLTDAATRRGITIFPIHLSTAEAGRLGDLSGAERGYRALGRTGDSNTDKYLGVDSGSVEAFGTMIGQAVAGLHGTIRDASGNRIAAPPPVQEGDMASLLVNEVFHAQLEYIGRTSGTQAPAFYRAWAAACCPNTWFWRWSGPSSWPP